MKNAMSSFDILAIVRELQILEDAWINKVFQVTPSELKVTLNIRDRGRNDLVIEAGRRIHLTKYPKPSPTKPSTFAMTLRKYIAGGIITEVRQLNFDRIVEFEIDKAGKFYLIAEFFGKGNVILADENHNIIAVMKPRRYKDRSLVVREKFELPPQKVNPYDISAQDLKELVNRSDHDLVRTLATQLGLGGTYAEEVCLISGVEKNKAEIDDEDAQKLIDALQVMREAVGRGGVIVYDDSGPIDVVPLKLKIYSGARCEEFPSFNEALDEYFTKHEIERVEALREEEYKSKIGQLEARLQEQLQTLERYVQLEEEYREKGELIYKHFNTVSEIISAISQAKETLSWEEIERRISEGKGKIPVAGAIKKILPKEGAVIVNLEGKDVKIDIRKSIGDNADYYYLKAKKVKKKIEGVKEAIEKTREEIKKVEEKGVEAFQIREQKPRKRKTRKKEWYEKFRWFVSSDGLLVLGGRDATTNEVLVKRHMQKGDIFVHADIHGAPAVLIKAEGREVPERSIREAFNFAASYSKAWKHGIFVLDVYWVYPEQVSKTTEHGEYVSKGAFIIRGKKNFGSGKVEAAIGVRIEGDDVRVVGGPPEAIEKQAKYSVRIVPGKMKSKEIAEEIKRIWLEKAKEEDKEKISAMDIQEIQEFLPPGNSEILRK
jgi:predicted ribosome quality control (RQC) complex YloA/Tae2 family protein